MEQKAKNIYEFKKGDIITRILPSKPYPSMYGMEPSTEFIGRPYEFVGIANGCLYIKSYVEPVNEEKSDKLVSLISLLYGNASIKPFNLHLDVWDEGWSYYIDPESMKPINKQDAGDINFNPGHKILNDDNYSLEELEKKLKDALQKEKYEEAATYRQQIDSLQQEKEDNGNN